MTRTWILASLLLASCAPKGPASAVAIAPAPPAPEPTAPAPPAKAGARPRLAPWKLYRVDLCYHGSFGMLLDRDEYLAALGGSPPGPGHVPSFVPLSRPSSLQHERYARACAVAATIFDVPPSNLDYLIGAYEPIVIAVAADLTAARTYYESDEHLQDGFARGRALHDRLMAAFAKLDELHRGIGAELVAYRALPPAAEMTEGEREARAAIEEARALLREALAPKPEKKALAARAESLSRAAALLARDDSVWRKTVRDSLSQLLETAGEVAAAGRVERATALELVNGFADVLGGRLRASAHPK